MYSVITRLSEGAAGIDARCLLAINQLLDYVERVSYK